MVIYQFQNIQNIVSTAPSHEVVMVLGETKLNNLKGGIQV